MALVSVMWPRYACGLRRLEPEVCHAKRRRRGRGRANLHTPIHGYAAFLVTSRLVVRSWFQSVLRLHADAASSLRARFCLRTPLPIGSVGGRFLPEFLLHALHR